MERITADSLIERYVYLSETEKGSTSWRRLRKLLVIHLHYTVKELEEFVQLEKQI